VHNSSNTPPTHNQAKFDNRQEPGANDIQADPLDTEYIREVEQAKVEPPWKVKAAWLEEEPDDVNRSSFTMGKRLGKGGFKTVYSGTYHGDSVAIGVVTSQSHQYLTQSEQDMTMDEISLQDKFREQTVNGRHVCRQFIPNIIAYHFDNDGKGIRSIFLVMELAGGDLAGKRFSRTHVHQATGVALQLLYGMVCVHQAGYVHKDIKELNALMSNDRHWIWTNDLGLSKATHDPEIASRWGTPSYMPPESAAVSLQRYDVFSLGIMFHNMGLEQSGGVPQGFVNGMVKADYRQRPTDTQLLEALTTHALHKPRLEFSTLKKSLTNAEGKMKDATRVLLEAIARRDAVEGKVRDAKDPGIAGEYERAEEKLRELDSVVRRYRRKYDEAIAKRNEVRDAMDSVLSGSKGKVERLETMRLTHTRRIQTAERSVRQTSELYNRVTSLTVDSRDPVRKFFKPSSHKVPANEKEQQIQEVTDKLEQEERELADLQLKELRMKVELRKAKQQLAEDQKRAEAKFADQLSEAGDAVQHYQNRKETEEKKLLELNSSLKKLKDVYHGYTNYREILQQEKQKVAAAYEVEKTVKQQVQQAREHAEDVEGYLIGMREKLMLLGSPDALLMKLMTNKPLALPEQ